MPARKDIILGQTFGRLTVLREVEPTRDGKRNIRRNVECQCECGVVVVACIHHMWYGHTRSCGCLSRETTSRIYRKHGCSGRTPEYSCWVRIIQRCEDSTIANFNNYGGRGIRMCERWRRSFANFLADMGPRPSVEHSIDRIDNNGHYEPSNCRWATRIQQANNKRSNRILTWNGKSQTVSEWTRELQWPKNVIKLRVYYEWDTERIFTTPIRVRNRKKLQA